MTKKDLLARLASYDDDQWVCVLLHTNSEFCPVGQVFIQDVVAFPPWHRGSDGKVKDLIGIVCHESNRELKKEMANAREGRAGQEQGVGGRLP